MLLPLRQLLGKHIPTCLNCTKKLVPDLRADELGRQVLGVYSSTCSSHRRIRAAVVVRAGHVVERFLDQPLGQPPVGQRQRREHDLAGRVVEVGVGDEGAEPEDFRRAVLCLLDSLFL